MKPCHVDCNSADANGLERFLVGLRVATSAFPLFASSDREPSRPRFNIRRKEMINIHMQLQGGKPFLRAHGTAGFPLVISPFEGRDGQDISPTDEAISGSFAQACVTRIQAGSNTLPA